VRLFFLAQNDISSPTVFRLDDISVDATLPTSCVNWNGGIPADPTLVTAAEYLCQNGVIDNNQDSNQINNTPPCKEVAYHIYNSLFASSGYSAISDSYPAPQVDIDPLTVDYSDAIKAMLYLEYSDGVPCFNRDYFNVGPEWGILRGRAVRAALEAWNIAPDISGFNPNSYAPSSFLCDVTENDTYYGWMKKAHSLGFFSGLTNNGCGIPCGANLCFGSKQNITTREFYIILYRIMNYAGGIPPAISASSYFTPNSYRQVNLSNASDLDRGVFNHYENQSFFIQGGGLPLTFGHSFHSSLSELPGIPYTYSVEAEKLWTQRFFPLGSNWTHNYNIYILCIPNSLSNSAGDYRLMIFWGDGTIQSYDPVSQQYQTSGVTDSLHINSFDANGNALFISIFKPDGTRYNFSRQYNIPILEISSIQDRNSNSILFNYELGDSLWSGSGNIYFKANRLSSVKDIFSGRILKFNYQNGTNLLSSVRDSSGNRTINFDVDPITRDLLDFYDAKGNHTHYSYSTLPTEKHLLKQIIKPLGNTITNTYYNRKLQSTQAGNYSIQVNWGQNYLGGGSTNSTVSVTQNGNTLTTSYAHDNRGNPTSITTPTGTVTMQYADSNNPDQPTQIVDSNTGITTTIQYEPNKKANPIFVSRSGSGNTITEQFQYNNFSQVTQYTDPDGNITQTIYDANGNITDINRPIGSTHFNYNANKLVESIVDSVGLTTNFHYNLYGNLDSLSIAGTNISASATYDAISRITGIRNPNGIKTGFTYDNNDNILTKRYDSLGVNYLTQNIYDANDNLITINSPRGLPTILTYDSTDALKTETYWSFSKQWDYNQDGTIKTFRNKNNIPFNYSYLGTGDPNAGKLQSDGYAGYEYYTSDKNLWKVSRNGEDILYGYDAFSRINDIKYTDLNGTLNSVQYVYYPNSNRLQRIGYPGLNGVSVTVEYTYDANNRLKRVKNVSNGNIYVDYTYRNDDKLLTEVFGNGTRNIYYYDNASRLDSIVTKKQNGDILAKVYCNYDPQGNHPEEFIRVYRSGPSSPPGSTAPDTAFNYVYDNMNRLTDRNGASYISNPNGAVLSNNPVGYTCTWDERDNMLSLTRNGITKTFEYDGLENRRLSDSTRYLIDLMHNENVLMETNLAGDPTSVYVYGLGLVCGIDPVTNHVYYYHYDFRGSTIAITDSTENVIQEYDYSAFGQIINAQGWYSSNHINNPFTYVGKYGVMDEGNGIYFMRARYYDSNIGRFISEDPKWDINLFPYGDNNPVTKIDPNGEYFETALDIASLGLSYYDYQQDKSLKNAAFLAWDAISVVAPLVPGSYSLKVAKALDGGKTFSQYKRAKGGTKTLDYIQTSTGTQRISSEFHHVFISQSTQKNYNIPNWLVNNEINVWKLNTIQHSLLDSKRFQFLRQGIKSNVGWTSKYNWFSTFK